MSATSSRLRRPATRLNDDVDAGDQSFEADARIARLVAEQQVAGAALLDPFAALDAAERILGRRNIAAREPLRCYQGRDEQWDSKPPLALIAGPTASGKSALALALAEAADGVVINADSAQVYRDLRIVSARPTPDDEARAPHRLYGYRDGADACSAADWAADAKAAIAEAHEAGRLPILVGGTGLYLRTLLDGIAPVPDDRSRHPRRGARAAGRRGPCRAVARGPRGGGAACARPTPRASPARWKWCARPAGRLPPGRPKRSAASAARSRSARSILLPPRDWLHARCDARFEADLLRRGH